KDLPAAGGAAEAPDQAQLFIGRSDDDLIYDDPAGRYDEVLAGHTVHFSLRHPDQPDLVSDVWIAPVYDHGEVIGGTVVISDISEHVNAMQALGRSERRFRSLVQR